MTLTLGLGAALSGLLTSQKGLDLVSHNIANVNTEGYARKQFNPESRVLLGTGVGVQIAQATREVDQGLLRDLRHESGIRQKLQGLSDYYARVQDLFGRPESTSSVSHIISTVQAEMESLSVTPSSATAQATAVDALLRSTQKLNTMTDQIQELRRQADRAVEDNISAINDLLTNIADLNNKIVRDTATSLGAADLEDKRDLALQKLSEQLDIQVFQRSNGAVVVFTTSGTSLVDSSAVSVSHSAITSVSPWQNNGSSDFQKISAGGTDITSELRQGRLKGLIDLRDSVLPNLQAELDQLTATMRNEINQVHNRGISFPDMTTSMTGSRTLLKDMAAVRTVAVDGYAAAGYTQTMTMSGGDVAVTLLNSQGVQVASTPLSVIMNTDYSVAAYQVAPYNNLAADVNAMPAGAAGSAWTVDQVTAHVQTWLRAAGATGATAAVGSTGKLAIALNSTSLSLAFRDSTGPSLVGTATPSTFTAGDTLSIGGTVIAIGAVSVTAAANLINAQAGTTGVYASNVNGKLAFTTNSPTAITITNGAGTPMATAGITIPATVVGGSDTAGDVSIAFGADGPSLMGNLSPAVFTAGDTLNVGGTVIAIGAVSVTAAAALINAQAGTTGVHASNVNGRLAFSTTSTTPIAITNGAGTMLATAGITAPATLVSGADRTVNGFSNFLGLNDLMVTNRSNWMWESNILSSTDTPLASGTLNFANAASGDLGSVVGTAQPTTFTAGDALNIGGTVIAIGAVTVTAAAALINAQEATTGVHASNVNGKLAFSTNSTTAITIANSAGTPLSTAGITSTSVVKATLSVYSSDTVTTIAARINADATLSARISASVVPEGGGYRLRIKDRNGEELSITQSGGAGTMINTLGLAASNCGLANIASVRDDIVATPQKITRGALQYSSDLGQYYASSGDNTNANEMANLFSRGISFTLAGKLSSTTRTFSDYAANILSQNASEAANIDDTLEYQNGLHQALTQKSAEVSAVNLDEEMSKLMTFQQSYTASAKVIATIQAMLDVLNDIIR